MRYLLRTRAPSATPTPAPPVLIRRSRRQRFNRGMELWASNRATAVTSFEPPPQRMRTHTTISFKASRGRDPGTLKRAELSPR